MTLCVTSRPDAERPERRYHAGALIVRHKSASTLIVPIAPRGHASRDAPRHKWHRLRIQWAERMTWITLELVHASAPHSRADAERPERHSHAERRNDQRDLKHAYHAHACAQRYTRVLLRPRTVGGIQSVTFVFAPRFARLADLCITMSAPRGHTARGALRHFTTGRGAWLRSAGGSTAITDPPIHQRVTH